MSYYNVFTVKEGQSLNQAKLVIQVKTLKEARQAIKALEDPIKKIKAFFFVKYERRQNERFDRQTSGG